ncbi:MAG: flagellin [Methanoculleus marisnigri]|nr:flagellin [Methanoculleus marisnigri]
MLEGMILCVVAILFAVLAAHALNAPPGHPAGFVYSALEETGGCLMVSGEVYGYALTGGTVDGVALVCDRPDPSRMGAVTCSVRLFVGDMGSVDIGRAALEVATAEGTERLARTAGAPVSPGNWTIARTGHTIPFLQADDDTLLEPGEQFDLVIYPSRPLAPGERFLIRITPPGGVPLTVERTVPPRTTPVMDLG